MKSSLLPSFAPFLGRGLWASLALQTLRRPLLAALSILCLLPAASALALWPSGGGGSLDDRARATVTDSAGNVYTVGDFRGTAFFGSGILTSEGLNDFFVVKYDVN
ncbi:MAG: hypothetical protein SX243_18995, partial [Acidobacteriota bacterium]|nr:hypothetical protein [Acidobacteriota bacterium]